MPEFWASEKPALLGEAQKEVQYRQSDSNLALRACPGAFTSNVQSLLQLSKCVRVHQQENFKHRVDHIPAANQCKVNDLVWLCGCIRLVRRTSWSHREVCRLTATFPPPALPCTSQYSLWKYCGGSKVGYPYASGKYTSFAAPRWVSGEKLKDEKGWNVLCEVPNLLPSAQACKEWSSPLFLQFCKHMCIKDHRFAILNGWKHFKIEIVSARWHGGGVSHLSGISRSPRSVSIPQGHPEDHASYSGVPLL